MRRVQWLAEWPEAGGKLLLRHVHSRAVELRNDQATLALHAMQAHHATRATVGGTGYDGVY